MSIAIEIRSRKMSFLIPTIESNLTFADKAGLVKWLYPGAEEQEQIMSNNQEQAESVKKNNVNDEDEQSSMQAKTSPSSTSAGKLPFINSVISILHL